MNKNIAQLDLDYIGGDRTNWLCPRCGINYLDKELERNARSRYEHSYICSDCGQDEALRDMTGEKPLNASKWACNMEESNE